MEYSIRDLLINAEIDPSKLHEEVETNSGKTAWIGNLLGEEIERQGRAVTNLAKLEGKAYDRISAELAMGLKKAPTVAVINAKIDQDEQVIKGRDKLAEIKGNVKKLQTLFDVYDKRFNMLQTRTSTMKKEMDNLKTGL